MHDAIASRCDALRIIIARPRHLHFLEIAKTALRWLSDINPPPNVLILVHLTSQMQRDALVTSGIDLHQRQVPPRGRATGRQKRFFSPPACRFCCCRSPGRAPPPRPPHPALRP
jgi:hypothetical protein